MTKDEKIRELFFLFLKKRKVFRKYMRNLKSKKCEGAGTVKVKEHYSFIREYFIWVFTPEKYEFWDKLNAEWFDMLKFLLEIKITKEMAEYKKFLEGEN